MAAWAMSQTLPIRAAMPSSQNGANSSQTSVSFPTPFSLWLRSNHSLVTLKSTRHLVLPWQATANGEPSHGEISCPGRRPSQYRRLRRHVGPARRHRRRHRRRIGSPDRRPAPARGAAGRPGRRRARRRCRRRDDTETLIGYMLTRRCSPISWGDLPVTAALAILKSWTAWLDFTSQYSASATRTATSAKLGSAGPPGNHAWAADVHIAFLRSKSSTTRAAQEIDT